MTLDEAHTLLDYHYWARDIILDAAASLSPEQYSRDLGNSFKSVCETLVHVYGAERTWYLRWVGNPPIGFPDPGLFPDVAGLRSAWSDQEEKVRTFAGELAAGDLERVFEYRFFNGEHTSSVFSHMLQHVVNHASYHRGQVTTMIRQMGAPGPKSQDLIHFHRQRARRT